MRVGNKEENNLRGGDYYRMFVARPEGEKRKFQNETGTGTLQEWNRRKNTFEQGRSPVLTLKVL